MKVMPYNSAIKTSNFGTNADVSSNPKKKRFKIDKWDAQMFALTCCMTAFEGVRCAKPNFKNLNIRGKIGRIIGGSLITVGLAALLMPLWKFLKKINAAN